VKDLKNMVSVLNAVNQTLENNDVKLVMLGILRKVSRRNGTNEINEPAKIPK